MAGGYDPELMRRAREAMGYAPMSAPPGAPMSGGDLLAEQDALLAQQQAEDAAMAGGAMLPPDQVMSVPPAALPPEENQQSLMSEPLASYPEERPAQAEQPAGPPTPRPTQLGGQRRLAGGGGIANPLPAMVRDAGARRDQAAKGLNDAQLAGDVAAAGLEQSAEELSATRQKTFEDIAKQRDAASRANTQAAQRLDDELDTHMKARAKVETRQREVANFIGSYQPKDRRNMGQKVLGALAVTFARMTDQVNLAAGLNIGLNVQTNLGATTASMIERGIDRDLEQQRMMLENKRTQLAAAGTELGQLDQRYGQRRENVLLGKAMKIDQAIEAMEGIKARGLGEEQSVLANQTIDELRLKRAEIDQQVMKADYEKAYQEERQGKLAIFAQQAAAAAARAKANKPLSAKEALELEGKALDNEGKRRDLARGPAAKLTAEQQKQASYLTGYESSARTLATAVAGGEAAPGAIEKSLPDAFRSTDALAAQTAENAMIEADLRIESGASISDGDIAAKRRSMGLDSSDPRIRTEARRKLLESHNAKRVGLGLDPVAPVVRKGAAR